MPPLLLCIGWFTDTGSGYISLEDLFGAYLSIYFHSVILSIFVGKCCFAFLLPIISLVNCKGNKFLVFFISLCLWVVIIFVVSFISKLPLYILILTHNFCVSHQSVQHNYKYWFQQNTTFISNRTHCTHAYLLFTYCSRKVRMWSKVEQFVLNPTWRLLLLMIFCYKNPGKYLLFCEQKCYKLSVSTF